jgi:hypothetical protein
MARETRNNYAAQWRAHNWRLLVVILIFITYLPAELWLSPFISKHFPAADGGLIIFLTWSVGLVSSGAYLLQWRCPRCHKPYFRKWGWLYCNPFALSCVNCKLPRWSLISQR